MVLLKLLKLLLEYLCDEGNTIINMGIWKCDHMVTEYWSLSLKVKFRLLR